MAALDPETLVVAVSSRALFDLEADAAVYREQGLDAFAARQREMSADTLSPGPAFALARGMLGLNSRVPAGAPPFVEVVVISSQHPATGVRVLDSISRHGLPITRAFFSGGGPTGGALRAFGAGLLLSRSEEDVQEAVDMGLAAAAMYDLPEGWAPPRDGCVRFAFDGDAVLFSDESEEIYRRHGLEAFCAHEAERALVPMAEGPHGGFLRALHRIRVAAPGAVRIALVTARGAPSGTRALRTLEAWGIGVDEAMILGGLPKAPFLREFAPCIFFDDQHAHLGPASLLVPAGRVPYRTRAAAA